MQTLRIWIAASLLCSAVTVQGQEFSSEPKRDPIGNPFAEAPIVEEDLNRFIEDLAHPSYHRREVAMRRLESVGEAAIPYLEKAALSGNLEMVDRASSILQSLAAKETPDDPAVAWKSLQRVKRIGPGSASTRAESAMDIIRDERSLRAHTRLAAANLKVGIQEVDFNMLSAEREAVVFPANWRFDQEALGWMPWMYDTTLVILEGEAVTLETIQAVVKMPRLVDVQIRNAKLTTEALRELEKLNRIDTLELQYVDVGADPEDLRVLAGLPIRNELVLTATRFDNDAVDLLRSALGGIEVTFSRGGFLGVRGIPGGRSEVTVVPGAAADKAGLRTGDVIVRLAGTSVETFGDLQEAIRQHAAGSSLEIEVIRAGYDRLTFTVELGRM